MPSRSSKSAIAEDDQRQIGRQIAFRAAADAVTARLAEFAEVERIALFGSASRPLKREVSRFNPFRRLRLEVLHECKDVDLAVWLTNLDRLQELGRARNKSVAQATGPLGGGVANHQVDVFLFDHKSKAYLGRLCIFTTCPKGKAECRVAGCGATLFLRQHEDFTLRDDALDNAVTLFERQSGTRFLACSLPVQNC